MNVTYACPTLLVETCIWAICMSHLIGWNMHKSHSQLRYSHKNANVLAQYKTYMNKLNKLKQVAKRNYYKKELDKHEYDIAKQWKTINEITCHKICHNDNPSTMTNSNNCMVTENADICKLLNDYFLNVGTSMDAKIPQATKKFKIPSVMQSFFHDPITPEEVSAQFQQLDPLKAYGPENIPIKFS